MKNSMFNILNTRSAFQFVLIAVLSVSLFSCDNGNVDTVDEMTVLNAVADDKKAAVAPADDPIAKIAIDHPDLNELVAALVYVDDELNAGLVDLFLNGTDQYTVFAPTDAAFQALYDALGPDVDDITDVSADLVLSVLQYHVTKGRRASNSVVPKKNTRKIVTLLDGATFDVAPDLSIKAVGSTANIKTADIPASNGMIHVIDSVLLPIE